MANEEFFVTVLALTLLGVITFALAKQYATSYFTAAAGNYTITIKTKTNPDGIKSLVKRLNEIMSVCNITKNGVPVVFASSASSITPDSTVRVFRPSDLVIPWGTFTDRTARGAPWNTNTDVITRANLAVAKYLYGIISDTDNPEYMFIHFKSVAFYNNPSNFFDPDATHIYNIMSPIGASDNETMLNISRAKFVRDAYNKAMVESNFMHPRTNKPIRFKVEPPTKTNNAGVVFANIDQPGMFITEPFESIDAKLEDDMKAHVIDYLRNFAR